MNVDQQLKKFLNQKDKKLEVSWWE